MPAERYFYPNNLIEKEVISLEDSEFHHLAHVMRAKEGGLVELVNGTGYLAKARIEAIKKKSAELVIQSVIHEPCPLFNSILAQAIPRGNRLDTILEKSTELGVSEIWLFPGKHSERKEISENQLEKITQTLIVAMKQCGRLYLPSIVVKSKLARWEPLAYPAYFGDVEPSAPLFLQVLQKEDNKQGIIFFIGPESGFNDDETARLKDLGAKGVKLNNNILRTDTAAIAAVALISHLYN